MSQIYFISLSFAAVVACIMALRMYGDWVAIAIFQEKSEHEELMKLRETSSDWVVRHLACAIAATILCVMIRVVPSLHAFPGADALLAGYGILSLLFASLDRTLSQQALLALNQTKA